MKTEKQIQQFKKQLVKKGFIDEGPNYSLKAMLCKETEVKTRFVCIDIKFYFTPEYWYKINLTISIEGTKKLECDIDTIGQINKALAVFNMRLYKQQE